MFWIWVVSVLLFSGFSAGDDPPPKANTTLGEVSGSWMKSRGDRTFAAFRTIPYAKPPVKELRFQAPVKYDQKWENGYDASKEMPVCMQEKKRVPTETEVMSEDCLYLSVFTHNITWNAPVIFYIHGGAFVGGTAADYGPEYMMDEDVVIVSTNYRLGVFGFLSFENELVPGNMGMKDQVMALKWVQENIKYFGGDPKKVTIQGGSAGGASVYHHIISPMSEGLFHQAIAESGTSYAPWALAPPGMPLMQALSYLGILNCTSSTNSTNPDYSAELSCARNKTASEILQAAVNQQSRTPGILPMIPCLEKSGKEPYLSGPPSKWNHRKVKLFTGVTSAEGLLVTTEIATPDAMSKYSQGFDALLPLSYGYKYTTDDSDQVTKQIRNYYFPNVKNLTLDNWPNVTKMYTDGMFVSPGLEGAHSHSGDVYFYYFDYPIKEATPTLNESFIIGAFHTLETAFLWRTKVWGQVLELTRKEDIELSKKLVKVVGNFVKNGSPQVEDIVPKWEKWTKDSQYYVHINRTNNQGAFYLKKGLRDEEYQFWKGLGLWSKVEKEMGGGGAPSIVICNFLLIISIILSARRLL